MAPMIPLMAKAASGVGFALTMSTTYHHPFYVARFFNALDHVTRGRIAWNAVTSAYKNEAANYGFDDMMDHDERYVRAQEFLEVACKLWDSVEQDALVGDRESGIFADPAKVHRIDHRGRYFNVRGPLPALPSPQQRPVIIQAGLSGPGMDLAATYADMQFSTRRTVAEHEAASRGARCQAGGGRPQAARRRHSLVDPHSGRRLRGRCAAKRSGAISPRSRRRPGWSRCRRSTTSISRRRRPGMRLADFADEVRAQKGNYGSFDELLKTTDPSQTVEEFGRRFLVDRILVAAGTPKSIVDKLEEMHVAVRRQRRLHPGPRLFGHGQHPRVRRARRARAATPRAVQEEIHGPTLRENLD